MGHRGIAMDHHGNATALNCNVCKGKGNAMYDGTPGQLMTLLAQPTRATHHDNDAARRSIGTAYGGITGLIGIAMGQCGIASEAHELYYPQSDSP